MVSAKCFINIFVDVLIFLRLQCIVMYAVMFLWKGCWGHILSIVKGWEISFSFLRNNIHLNWFFYTYINVYLLIGTLLYNLMLRNYLEYCCVLFLNTRNILLTLLLITIELWWFSTTVLQILFMKCFCINIFLTLNLRGCTSLFIGIFCRGCLFASGLMCCFVSLVTRTIFINRYWLQPLDNDDYHHTGPMMHSCSVTEAILLVIIII